MAFHVPIANLSSVSLNTTLHGRSVFRPQNVPHHNVYKGYNNPGTGDANDLFCPAGTPVFAVEDGHQTQIRGDGLGGTVIYLEANGFTAVYAHIDPVHTGVNHQYSKGDIVAHVGNHINHTHVHFELWINGHSVNAPTPGKLRMKFIQLTGGADDTADDSDPRLIVAKPGTGPMSLNGLVYNEMPARFDHVAGEFLVDTHALGAWLGKSSDGLAAMLPIREALRDMNVDASFNVDNLFSTTDPRVYVFSHI